LVENQGIFRLRLFFWTNGEKWITMPEMGGSFFQSFRELLQQEKPLHRVERKATKFWIKRRLLHLFPELENDPTALEDLYRALDLEARPGTGSGGSTTFEVVVPEKYL